MDITVKITNSSNNLIPNYATEGSAGLDLMANIVVPTNSDTMFKGFNFEIKLNEENEARVLLHPQGVVLISTGLRIELPIGYEAQIRPRSGLAINHGIGVLNSPGTIDSDYRGNIGVILFNFGFTAFTINNGDRIAQMVINKYERVALSIVEELSNTDRGSGGFGHTGK